MTDIGEHGGDPHEPERLYTNHLAVEISLSQAELRFAQRAPNGQHLVKCLLVCTPVHLAAFSQVILASLASYTRRFGTIPTGTDAGHDEPRH